jgi:hypothetical protein
MRAEDHVREFGPPFPNPLATTVVRDQGRRRAQQQIGDASGARLSS